MNLFRSSSCIFVFAYIIFICGVFSKSKGEDSYSYAKHCSSLIPPGNIYTLSDGDSLPSLSTTYFTGGDRFQRNPPDLTYNYASKNLKLRLRPDHYQTTAAGVYKVEGFLHINFANGRDDAPGGRAPLRFPMNGFWSEKSRKLCMVGSTSWMGINNIDSVLKLKFDDENPTIYTGVVSGSLESTASAADEAYFDPILIFDFPASVADYSYSLVSEGIGAVFPTRKGESLSLDSTEFCTVMERGLMSLELEYATECAERRRPHRCSPVGVGDESLPDTVFLTSIQCAKGAKTARFLAKFLDNSRHDSYDSFPIGSTVIGEAWWDGKNNRIIGVGCVILNPSLHFENSVGDCSLRLSLRQPSVLTMRDDSIIIGEIWSAKAVEDSGYFTQINVTVAGDNGAVLDLPEQRYEYTEVVRARKWCAMEKPLNKSGNLYPDGQSNDMRFDTNIKNSQGQKVASAYAAPVWVESNLFRSRSSDMLPASAIHQLQKLQLEEERGSTSSPTRMSYKIRIQPSFFRLDYAKNISTPSLDWPVLNPSSGVEMTAEGEYDAENGHLCMVGCRKLAGFKDCEIVVEFDLPMLNGERGRLVKGILRSTRPRTDPLHFDDLIVESAAYNQGEAKRSIWRMDFEITMVFISNALVCIFVALQIFHVKRNPEAPSSVSLVMLVILCAGHVIPLVLNFEAVFLGYRDTRMVELGNGGRLEANEVAVRVITMVTLLLKLRLLQLVYARKESWSGEKRAGFATFSFYILGGLLSLVLRKTFSVWGGLRTYGGVILDGFLLPQVLLNMVKGSASVSAEKALCCWFYVGTSALRLVPHAYNQYRSRNYPMHDLNSTYYYANPAANLYSKAWDFMIIFVIIALSMIVFLQQRKGGRCILPQRFKGFEKN